MRTLLLLTISVLLFSCGIPTIETVGGTKINLTSPTPISEETAEILLDRLWMFSKHGDYLTYNIEDNNLTINAVGVSDQESIKELLAWNRMMKVVHAIPTSSYPEIRNTLSKYISTPSTKLPYKPTSLIGLVDKENKTRVLELINSTEFQSNFPKAGRAYFGIKKMEGKYALFIEDKTSVSMTEDMFKTIVAQEDTKNKEGRLSLELKEEYSENIGKLTGNDSTYLLHIFHDEVYISKIIKPHITSPSFGMAGAFSRRDVMVLSSIWNADELSQQLDLVAMETK